MIRNIIFIVLFLLQIQYTYSQLTLQIKQIDETGNINTQGYPIMSADIKVLYNGVQVALKKDDIKYIADELKKALKDE